MASNDFMMRPSTKGFDNAFHKHPLISQVLSSTDVQSDQPCVPHANQNNLINLTSSVGLACSSEAKNVSLLRGKLGLMTELIRGQLMQPPILTQQWMETRWSSLIVAIKSSVCVYKLLSDGCIDLSPQVFLLFNSYLSYKKFSCYLN